MSMVELYLKEARRNKGHFHHGNNSLRDAADRFLGATRKRVSWAYYLPCRRENQYPLKSRATQNPPSTCTPSR